MPADTRGSPGADAGVPPDAPSPPPDDAARPVEHAARPPGDAPQSSGDAPQSSDAARPATLVEQQTALVAALVAAGPDPAGFDPARLNAARQALLRKRAGEVATPWPRLALSAGNRSTVDAAVAALGAGNAAGLVADLAQVDTAQRLIDTARDRFGRIDGALLSVGGPPPGQAVDMSDEQWQNSFTTVFL